MMVFCKVSYMKYYKGASDKDIPYNGGRFVHENGYGYEEYNFLERNMETWDDDSGIIANGTYCLGHVETKHTGGERNQLHIEKIMGCSSLSGKLVANGADVIWCATSNRDETSVIGWYRNAKIYRRYQKVTDASGDERGYNVMAKSSDCVLIPDDHRHKHIWNVPSRKYTKAYGFGQSMLWYAKAEKAEQYLKRLSNDIENYNGENWLRKYPE